MGGRTFPVTLVSDRGEARNAAFAIWHANRILEQAATYRASLMRDTSTTQGAMAFAEDVFGSNLAVAALLGATALLLPKVVSGLPVPVRSAVKGGVNLFLESESEAEGGIIERLAEAALKNALAGLSASGSDSDRRKAAQQAVEHFKRTARSRAHRYGSNEHDRSARYKRHIRVLRHKLERAESHRSGSDHSALATLLAALDKEGSPHSEEHSHGTA